MSREEIVATIYKALEDWKHEPLHVDLLTERISKRADGASADKLFAAAVQVMRSQARAIEGYRCDEMDVGRDISRTDIAALIDEALKTEVQAPGLIAGDILERVHGVRNSMLAISCLRLLLDGNVELATKCRQMQEENERRVAAFAD